MAGLQVDLLTLITEQYAPIIANCGDVKLFRAALRVWSFALNQENSLRTLLRALPEPNYLISFLSDYLGQYALMLTKMWFIEHHQVALSFMTSVAPIVVLVHTYKSFMKANFQCHFCNFFFNVGFGPPRCFDKKSILGLIDMFSYSQCRMV